MNATLYLTKPQQLFPIEMIKLITELRAFPLFSSAENNCIYRKWLEFLVFTGSYNTVLIYMYMNSTPNLPEVAYAHAREKDTRLKGAHLL